MSPDTAETRKALESKERESFSWERDYRGLESTCKGLEHALESARDALAKAGAQVKAATSPLVKSIGQCSHCGERAPLMEGAKLPSHRLKLICVYGWGCSAGEALRG